MFGSSFTGKKGGQVSELQIAGKRQPIAHDVGVDAMVHGDTGNRGTRLRALLDDLSFEGLRMRGFLVHGDPLVWTKNGVYLMI
ncbi:hypothetical protein D3C85_1315470 [compost metagenome]